MRHSIQDHRCARIAEQSERDPCTRGGGESVDIVRRGREIAVLSAPVVDDEHWMPSADPSSPNFRRPGALKGKMWISDNFNDPDPELEAMMEADIFPSEQ